MKYLLTLLLASLFTFNLLANSKSDSDRNKPEVKAKRYYGYAKKYKMQAMEAKKCGKAELASALEECAKAKTIMAKAYETGNKELLKKGEEAYSQARKKLSNAKKRTKCKK